jgi:aminoglycoside 3-N-acetyltransferase
MFFQKDEIDFHLNSLGLNHDDTVVIHGDAGVAAQYKFKKSSDVVSEFAKSILSYFNEGTVLIPSFTYSTLNGSLFDKEATPSEVGLFSESFRNLDDSLRSNHPVFSFSCFGKDMNYFSESEVNDCFGENTIFDKLYLSNAKILTLGCSFDRVTFVHYVEQKLKISYRFFKNFGISKLEENVVKKTIVSYFVRRLDLESETSLNLLEKEALKSKKLKKESFGRFVARVISAKDFYDTAANLISENEYSLIKQESE